MRPVSLFGKPKQTLSGPCFSFTDGRFRLGPTRPAALPRKPSTKSIVVDSRTSDMPAIDPDDPRIERAANTVAGVLAARETSGPPADGLAAPAELDARGYLLPDEDQALRLRYAQFLAARAALLGVLAAMERALGRDARAWPDRLPALVVALAAGALLARGAAEWVAFARGARPVRKKLDEADAAHGLPRKTFARLYRDGTDLRQLARFRAAADFFRGHRDEFAGLDGHPTLGGLLRLLDGMTTEPWASPSESIRDRFRYRWFSFRRRHHSAWKQTVFELFRWSGSHIAELRQPGVKPAGAPKAVTTALREAVLERARPGDVFVTRHEDALSNLFLPGFWPHAALHLGSEAQRREIGLVVPGPLAAAAADPVRFLEARKDGVRLREAADTLAVDALVVLRPPLDDGQLAEALVRALGHTGKLYDFVFDFRTADRLACTELAYRAFHGLGPLSYRLRETGGRLCLPAEELIAQSLEQGFRVVASVGIGDAGLLTGRRAELALHRTRCGF